MKHDVERFCRALGAELKARFIRATDLKTRDRLRLHQLAEMADTTDTTLRTLFRGGADGRRRSAKTGCFDMVRTRVDLCLVLRTCTALDIHIIDVMQSAKLRLEGGK